MISATVLAVVFVPAFFVFVMKLFDRSSRQVEPDAPGSVESRALPVSSET